MSNQTPKSLYLAIFRTNKGAVHSVPVSMDKEIDTVQDYQSLVNTVSKYAVAQEMTRGLDDVSIVGLSLLNPGRDINAIANEMLKKAFVELYEGVDAAGHPISSEVISMYESIKGVE